MLIKLHVDEEIYKEAQNTLQNLIWKKKKMYFEEKVKENTKSLKKKKLENLKAIRSAGQKINLY